MALGTPKAQAIAPDITAPVTAQAASLHATAAAPAAAAASTSKPQSADAVIIGIWQNLLGVSGITAQDNFFELGGNSLLAMVAVEETRKALGVEVDPRRFVYETLAQIAASAAPAQAGATSANDAPQCPPARPEQAPAKAEASAGKRRGWLDRARDALTQRTGTDGSR